MNGDYLASLWTEVFIYLKNPVQVLFIFNWLTYFICIDVWLHVCMCEVLCHGGQGMEHCPLLHLDRLCLQLLPDAKIPQPQLPLLGFNKPDTSN